MKYGIVLKEKPFLEGLSREDVIGLFDILDDTQAYPIELEAKRCESSAMGFISPEVADYFEYDYNTSGLRDFIATILEDMNNESDTFEYEFKGIKIWMSR